MVFFGVGLIGLSLGARDSAIDGIVRKAGNPRANTAILAISAYISISKLNLPYSYFSLHIPSSGYSSSTKIQISLDNGTAIAIKLIAIKAQKKISSYIVACAASNLYCPENMSVNVMTIIAIT